MSALNSLPTKTHINPEQGHSTEGVPNDLYAVAQDLTAKANAAREAGDHILARRLLIAALSILGEDLPKGGRQVSPDVAKILGLLNQGWQEVSQLSEATGLPTARVHTIIAKIRGKGSNLQTQSVKRYRIVSYSPKE